MPMPAIMPTLMSFSRETIKTFAISRYMHVILCQFWGVQETVGLFFKIFRISSDENWFKQTKLVYGTSKNRQLDVAEKTNT